MSELAARLATSDRYRFHLITVRPLLNDLQISNNEEEVWQCGSHQEMSQLAARLATSDRYRFHGRETFQKGQLSNQREAAECSFTINS